MLGPVLEKLAREYDGKFLLAKVDTDRESELALQFGVRSIPAVFGVRDGKAVDGLRRCPARVGDPDLDRPALTLRRPRRSPPQARRLELTDPQAAEEKYNAALVARPRANRGKNRRLARIALEQGRLEDAQARILGLERRGFLEPEAEKIKAELMLRLQAGQAGSVEAARAALAANPDDLNLKFPARRGPGRRRPVCRCPGTLPRARRTRPQGNRREGPPDHGRDLSALASRFRAGHGIPAPALAGADGMTQTGPIRAAFPMGSLW